MPPRSVGHFPKSFKIPQHITCAGKAVQVLYRSDKLNPSTGEDEGVIDYFHDHKPGVKLYLVDEGGPERKVPASIANADVLVLLGSCLGFSWEEDGETVEADVKRGRKIPDLYTIASGKALLVVEGKQRVIAMMWGGELAVEWRGIVG